MNDQECEPTYDELLMAGLIEGADYRDFPPPDDCYPEDGDERYGG